MVLPSHTSVLLCIMQTDTKRGPVYRMMQEWGAVSPAQLICRPGSHPDVRQQACVETGRGCFPSTPYSIHPPQHAQPPSWQSQAFSQTINCALSWKTHTLIRREKKHLGRYDFTGSFPTPSLKQRMTQRLETNTSWAVCVLERVWSYCHVFE